MGGEGELGLAVVWWLFRGWRSGWSWVSEYHEGQPTCRRRELAVSTDRLRIYHGRGHPVRLQRRHPFWDHPILTRGPSCRLQSITYGSADVQ